MSRLTILLTKEVEKIEAAPNTEKSFVITFKAEGPGKKPESREYQTETKMECQEIVAKVNFLMNNPM